MNKHRPISVIFTCLAAILVLLSGCATPTRDFARAVQDTDSGAVVRGVPVYEAREPHNAASALAMILHYWKRPGPVQRVSERVAGRNPADVDITPFLERYLGQEGLWVHARRGDLDDIRERLRSGVPPMALIQAEPLDGATLRAVVLTGFDDRREVLLAHAGRRRAEILSYADFSRQWDQALRVLLTVSPPHRTAWPLNAAELTSRGKFHEARRNHQAALDDYLHALDERPDDPEAYVNTGDMYRQLGRSPEAERLYRAAIALDDLNARACNNLAFLLAEENRDIAEALHLARRAVQLQPDNPNMLDTLGLALYRAGDLAEAARVLSRARARATELPADLRAEIGMRLVRVYDEQDLPHLARQVLADVLRFKPRMAVPPEFQDYIRLDQPVYR